MNNINILDCTLRDGGYCNEWHFGLDNARKIVKGLSDSGIEIVELGFLTNKIKYNPDFTKFNDITQAESLLPCIKTCKIYALMINYGEYNSEDLPEYKNGMIDGLRVAFHKKNIDEALNFCGEIKSKGYKLFIQAMVSLNYSDLEFIRLINDVNKIKPYAFYIVDSFGTMNSKDLTRLFSLVENNLAHEIIIGFHSHNNLQLAYSNAQKLITMQSRRDLIIDSSVYGMGRGAGNLTTELFVDYLNHNAGKNYLLSPLLGIIDEILDGFYQRKHWGYSLPNYLSAVHGAHPNYAIYLADKNTLTVKEMNEIFDSLDPAKKISYDKNYIEQVYLRYMSINKSNSINKSRLNEILSGKKILLIAPGKSSFTERDKIMKFAGSLDCVIISVNFEYKYLYSDFIFLSNLRRLRELDPEKISKCIITSNINLEGAYLKADYQDLIFTIDSVRDNAGLMAVRFLIAHGVKEIYLAGFDGYSHDSGENYGDEKMIFSAGNEILDSQNRGMIKILHELSRQVSIKFLTTPRHVKI